MTIWDFADKNPFPSLALAVATFILIAHAIDTFGEKYNKNHEDDE